MLSILIVNWNTREHLRRCLGSIRAFPPDAEYEVIVVDNASSDGSAQMVCDEYPEVALIASKENTGYARGNNIAYEYARGDLLLLLNPDTEFEDNSLQAAAEALSANEDTGALAIRLIDPEPPHKTQRSIRSFPRPLPIFFEIIGLSRLFPNSNFFAAYRRPNFNYDAAGPAEQPMGTFLMLRRSALPKDRFMDERFPIFFNDVDLLYRMHLAGQITWYTPNARVLHYGGASTEQTKKKMIWESHRSLIRYYTKWYLRWWSAPLIIIFALVVWIGAFVRARGWDAGFRS